MTLERPLTDAQLKALLGSLNPDRIENRQQGGAQLSYLAAWDVKATLIRVFGFGGFSAEADECEIISIENNVPKTTWKDRKKVTIPVEYGPDNKIVFGSANFRVTARVRVKLTIHQLGAVYTEWASSSQTGPDIGDVSDFAIKTAESDALKRAAIYLGTQFGLSLYDSGSTRDVVKVIMSPEQQWPKPATGAQEVETLNNIAAGGVASTTPEQEENAAKLAHSMGMKRASDIESPDDRQERLSEEAMAESTNQ